MAAWLELGDRYRVVVVNPSKPDNLDARAREERLAEAMYKLVLRGQAEGEFSTDVPPLWGGRPWARCWSRQSAGWARAGSGAMRRTRC